MVQAGGEQTTQDGAAEPTASRVGTYGQAVHAAPVADEREPPDGGRAVLVADGGVEGGPTGEDLRGDGERVGVPAAVDGPPEVEPVGAGCLGDVGVVGAEGGEHGVGVRGLDEGGQAELVPTHVEHAVEVR